MALSQNDNWVRRFAVTDPRKHKKGFTVYKVTSIVFPKGSPQAASRVIVWKRYNDFKKLHKELKERHQQLHLKDKFPLFAKTKMFGRFDEEVIETRRKSALLLLEFAGEQLPLFNSEVCTQFLKAGYSVEENSDPNPDTSHPPQLFLHPSVSIVSPDDLEPQVEPSEAPAQNSLLGGTWQFPQVPDTISISSISSDDPTTFTDTDSSILSGVSTPLHGSDLQFFDPLHQSPAKQANPEASTSNSWLLTLPAATTHSTDPSPIEESPLSPDREVESASESVRGHTELPVKMFLSVRTEDFHTANLPRIDQASQDVEPSDTAFARPFSPSDLDNSSLNQNVNYIFEAAYHVGQAQLNEANGEFEAAFSFYKAGIGCLLCGVQDETDAKRKVVVSKKISKYLVHAEKLYKSHLVCQPAGRRQTVSQLCRPLSELKCYRVLGVVGKLMLVMNSLDDRCYTIKVLYKSSCPANAEVTTIIPQNVPYMVKMFCYFETDSAVFLVLQHASGGRLWQHISSYFQSCPTSPAPVLTNENPYMAGKLRDEARNPLFSPTFRKESINIDIPKHNRDAFLAEIDSAGEDESYMELIRDYTSKKNQPKLSTEDRFTAAVNGINGADNLKESNENGTSSLGGLSNAELPAEPMDSLESVKVSNEERIEISTNNNLATQDFQHNFAWNILDTLPTDDLLKNAQRLLESVSETLIKTEAIVSRVESDELAATESGNLQVTSEERTKEKSNPRRSLEKRRTTSRRRSRQSSERRFSSDDMVLKSMEWCRLEPAPAPRLPEATVQCWAAQALVCIDTLHRWGVKCRDLRPDNILLGEEGQLLMTYMCEWEGVDTMANPDAIRRLYSAPEVNGIFPFTQAADWWSYGAVIYELITGRTLISAHPGGIHSHTIISIPDCVSDSARSLLKQLLKYNPSERLGSGSNASEELKLHPFFQGVDWQAVLDAGAAM